MINGRDIQLYLRDRIDPIGLKTIYYIKMDKDCYYFSVFEKSEVVWEFEFPICYTHSPDKMVEELENQVQKFLDYWNSPLKKAMRE